MRAIPKDLRLIPWGDPERALPAFLDAWHGIESPGSETDLVLETLRLVEEHGLFGINTHLGVIPGSERSSQQPGQILSDPEGLWEIVIDTDDPRALAWRLSDPDWEPEAMTGAPIEVLFKTVVSRPPPALRSSPMGSRTGTRALQA